MRKLVAAVTAVSVLSGCATVENFTDKHPGVVVACGAALLVGGLFIAAHQCHGCGRGPGTPPPMCTLAPNGSNLPLCAGP
jgi:hypothetical protein